MSASGRKNQHDFSVSQHDLLQKRCKHAYGNHWHWLHILSLSFSFLNIQMPITMQILFTELNTIFIVDVAWPNRAQSFFFWTFLCVAVREKDNTQINPIPSSSGRCLTNRIFVWIHLAFIWMSICMHACIDTVFVWSCAQAHSYVWSFAISVNKQNAIFHFYVHKYLLTSWCWCRRCCRIQLKLMSVFWRSGKTMLIHKYRHNEIDRGWK